MRQNRPTLTVHIGFRVSQATFDQILLRADKEGKPANDWCRERVLEAAKQPLPSPAEHALMAEVTATQNIAISLIYEMASGKELTRDRVQQILDAAHAAKYRDADERLRHASGRGQSGAPERVGVHNT